MKFQKGLITETQIIISKISNIKFHKSKKSTNNQTKEKNEKFSLSNFPMLNKDFSIIREFISTYDFQSFRTIFIQFTKHHKIDAQLIKNHKILVDIIIKRKIPIEETTPLLRI